MNRIEELTQEFLASISFAVHYEGFDDVSDAEDFYINAQEEQKCSALDLQKFVQKYSNHATSEMKNNLSKLVENARSIVASTHEQCEKIYGAGYLHDVLNIDFMARKFEEKHFSMLIIKGLYLGWIPTT